MSTATTGLREQVPAGQKTAEAGLGSGGHADHHSLRHLRDGELRHVLRPLVVVPQGAEDAVLAVAVLYPLPRHHAQLRGALDPHGPQDHSQWSGVWLQKGQIRPIRNE